MTLYPCPRCGRAPAVSTRPDKAGTLWTASCSCFDAHAYDKAGLAYSWALYCLKMEDEMEESP